MPLKHPVSAGSRKSSLKTALRLPAAVLILFQAACTSVLWNGGVYDADRAIETNTAVRTEADRIVAMTLVPQSAQNPLSGSLMMLGGRYWYAVRPPVSYSLAQTLQARLSQPYRIVAPYSGLPRRSLPVRITDQNHFYSSFCLDYTLSGSLKSREETVLQSLGFQQQQRSSEYRKCFAAAGTVYRSPPDGGAYTAFVQAVPAELSFQEKKTNVRRNKLVRNVLFTPVALAADTISGILMMPVLLLGDLF